MDHRTIVSFFTCQLVWVNRYRREALIKDGKEAFVDMDVFYRNDIGYRAIAREQAQ